MENPAKLSGCPYDETLILIQAIPLCRFDKERKKALDDLVGEMERRCGGQVNPYLPAACLSTMSCAEALDFIRFYGDTDLVSIGCIDGDASR